jgi:hypothetical protein
MIIRSVVLQGFRCFGPVPTCVDLESDLTVFIGDNGSGKTALMLALQRILGTGRQSIVRQDFHVPVDELSPPHKRTLTIELRLTFPELEDNDATLRAVPDFFNHMTTDESGTPTCRLRLDATWVNNGTNEGVIDQQYNVVLPPEPGSADEKLARFTADDRAYLRMVYVPAVRDGRSHVTDFLRGRLWQGMRWSDNLRETLKQAGTQLNDTFLAEPGVQRMSAHTAARWQSLYSGGTDSTPVLAPVDLRLAEFVRGVQMTFRPDESGGNRPLSELSDGQRSLFHISMAAATLDVEATITDDDAAWDTDQLTRHALTVVAVEEPENNLSPFYLSRIVRQLQDIASRDGVQAIISSHSSSILARIEPGQVRHFRIEHSSRAAQVKNIDLPTDTNEAAKYVREAVRTYPELYFASFVVLGEGSSEEVVIPRVAEAMGLEIDRSFVAVVPLGGRHVNHLWRLLAGLGIPHATLLDLDMGRNGGGWGRIRDVCRELLAIGIDAKVLLDDPNLQPQNVDRAVNALGSKQASDHEQLDEWIARLRKYGVYFCEPLDLDMAMLRALPEEYTYLEPERTGPQSSGADTVVLGNAGDASAYPADEWADDFRWYRYLFLGRGKPNTHVHALARTTSPVLAAAAPEALRSLIVHVAGRVLPPQATIEPDEPVVDARA